MESTRIKNLIKTCLFGKCLNSSLEDNPHLKYFEFLYRQSSTFLADYNILIKYKIVLTLRAGIKYFGATILARTSSNLLLVEGAKRERGSMRVISGEHSHMNTVPQ